MMWCSRVRSRLSAYADGELDAAQARRVEEHLGCCETCASELKSLRELARCIGLIPEEDLPGDLHGRIMMRLAYADAAPALPEPLPFRRQVNPWMVSALGGAVAAVALGLVVLRMDGLSRMEPPPVHARSADEPARPAPVEARDAPAPPAEAPQVRQTETPHGAPTHEAAVAHPSPPTPPRTAASPAPARQAAPAAPETKGELRTVVAPKPKPVQPARETRARAADGAPSEKPAADPRGEESDSGPAEKPAAATNVGGPIMAAIPGEPNASGAPAPGQPEPVVAAMEKDPTRMAGMTMESPAPADEDEGLRQLRMFFEERSRSIPQPPLIRGDRRMRKL